MGETKPTPSEPTRTEHEKHLLEQVEAKEARKLRARRDKRRVAWFWLGMSGLVGWSVALPTVLGAALGLWIDRTWPSRYSWTLTLLLFGVILGCLNAWFWLTQESRRNES